MGDRAFGGGLRGTDRQSTPGRGSRGPARYEAQGAQEASEQGAQGAQGASEQAKEAASLLQLALLLWPLPHGQQRRQLCGHVLGAAAAGK